MVLGEVEAQPSRLSGDRNASVPVNSLYPDILSHIFRIIAQDARWVYRRYVPQVSHVCRYWRSVALQSPNLWNKFTIESHNFFNNPWTHECLRRAEAGLLHIKAFAHGQISVDSIHETFPDFLRFQSLDIGGNLRYLHTIFRPYIEIPNPYLQSLTITTAVGGLIPEFRLFGNNMPNLETLKLTRYIPHDWTSLTALRSLKHLNILVSAKPPIFTSLGTFALLPQLEELTLSIPDNFSNTSMVGRIPQIDNPVYFQSLRKLEITDPTTYMANHWLVNVNIPSNASIHLTCQNGSKPDYLNLLSVLTQILTANTPSILQTPIHCLYVAPDGLTAQPWDDSGALTTTPNHQCLSLQPFLGLRAKPRIKIWFFPMSRHGTVSRSFLSKSIIRPLIDLLNLQHLHALSWEHYDPGSRTKLDLDEKLFERMKELRTIEVKTADAGFLDGITPRDVVYLNIPREELSNYAVQCPKLDKIIMVVPDMSFQDGRPADLFNKLWNKLSRRKAMAGRQLDGLTILGHHDVSSSEKWRLQEVARVLDIKE